MKLNHILLVKVNFSMEKRNWILYLLNPIVAYSSWLWLELMKLASWQRKCRYITAWLFSEGVDVNFSFICIHFHPFLLVCLFFFLPSLFEQLSLENVVCCMVLALQISKCLYVDWLRGIFPMMQSTLKVLSAVNIQALNLEITLHVWTSL